jgi:hypothetical protein
LGFAVAVFLFHHLPGLVGARMGDVIDMGTPFAVIGAATGVLVALRARGAVLLAALLAGVLYVHGHGVHLAANSIANEGPSADLEDIVHFWDEELSHVEIVLGWFGLVASFCLAERAEFEPGPRAARPRVALLAIAAALLGWTFFTSTVEGGTWPLELAATAAFVAWAARARRPVLRTVASAFALGGLLIGVWAAWQGGVPEFSEAGWL